MKQSFDLLSFILLSFNNMKCYNVEKQANCQKICTKKRNKKIFCLFSTEEYIDGKFAGNLGEVLIRCVARDRASNPKNQIETRLRDLLDLFIRPPTRRRRLTSFPPYRIIPAHRRCNNVLYLRGAPEDEEGGGAEAME